MHYSTQSPFADVDMTPYYEEIARYEKIAPYYKALFEYLNAEYCPVTLLYYRKSKPRLRKVKKHSTIHQNNNSYCTVCLLDFNDLGTIKRSLKHKGFSQLIAFLPPNPRDIENQKRNKRIVRYTFIDLEEVRLKHSLTDQELKPLSVEFPTKAYGQLSMKL
ncbi:MAG: hypothetical protein RID25_23350 [Cyclobacteriaceae bacterium]